MENSTLRDSRMCESMQAGTSSCERLRHRGLPCREVTSFQPGGLTQDCERQRSAPVGERPVLDTRVCGNTCQQGKGERKGAVVRPERPAGPAHHSSLVQQGAPLQGREHPEQRL